MFIKELVLIISFVGSMTATLAKDSFDISSLKLREFQRQKRFEGVILDVRTPDEWKETGVIRRAVVKNAYDSDFKSFVEKLDTKKTYFVYCHSGVRSAKVQKLMSSYKLKSYNISDGISGWIKNKLPLENFTENRKIKRILKSE